MPRNVNRLRDRPDENSTREFASETDLAHDRGASHDIAIETIER
jgi:hypothetical protein